MHRDEPPGTPIGYTCPTCGGPLWQQRDGGTNRFQCRIGDAFSAIELWIEHCVTRNRSLQQAAAALAENAALARTLADWNRQQGNLEAASRLEAEAAADEQLREQVQQGLAGLDTGDSDSAETD